MATKLYEILEVHETATAEEIRKAYKKRALKTHPDRLGPTATPEEKKSAEEQFRLVNHAYEILTDAEKRKEYDLHGQWPPPAQTSQASQGRRTHVYEEFDDDPFSHPFFHNHNQFQSFAFTDPFTLFESIFGSAVPQHSGPAIYSSTSLFASDPFTQMHRQPDSEMTGFTPFAPLSAFGGLLGALSGGLSSSGGFIQGGQTFGAGSSGGQWASESYSTQITNGVAQTIHSRRDWEGNEHVTRIHADGREVYTINGVEQPARGQIANQPTQTSLTAPPQQPKPSSRTHRHSSKRASSSTLPQQQSSSQPRFESQYAMGPPPQTGNPYPNQQRQYPARSQTQPYTDSNKDSSRRRDSHRGEKRRHSPSREVYREDDGHQHHHHHQSKTPRTSSRRASTIPAPSSSYPYYDPRDHNANFQRQSTVSPPGHFQWF